MASKDILISMPTNNCARILLFVKLNELDDVVDLKTPQDYGGLKSPEYLAINPQAKFPAFISAAGNYRLYEAQVILDYLAEKYRERIAQSKFSCQALLSTAEERAKIRLIIQVHDLYIASANCTQPGYFATQGCMYKAEMPIADRCARSLELAKQLDVLESLWSEAGPYACGAQMTLADLVVYPTFIFVQMCAHPALGWNLKEMWAKRPKLYKWFSTWEALENDAIQQVREQVYGFCTAAFLSSGRCADILKKFDCDEARAALGIN